MREKVECQASIYNQLDVGSLSSLGLFVTTNLLVATSQRRYAINRCCRHAAGVWSNGSLVYRAFSTSMTSATRPSGLRKGKGFPTYLREIGSITLRFGSGRRSTTRPRIWAST